MGRVCIEHGFVLREGFVDFWIFRHGYRIPFGDLTDPRGVYSSVLSSSLEFDY